MQHDSVNVRKSRSVKPTANASPLARMTSTSVNIDARFGGLSPRKHNLHGVGDGNGQSDRLMVLKILEDAK